MAGIYFHIPFCKQACHYCDFHFSTSLKLKEDLIKAMHIELKLRSQELTDQVTTIYFGGGTPSILSKEELHTLIAATKDFYNCSSNVGITLEANPDDLISEKLNELKEIGVDRLSIGLQSFDDDQLVQLNRAHTAKESLQCIKLAQQAGFKDLSIDLIYALPKQSDDEWKAELDRAIDLDVQHVSAYCLTVEKGTALHHFVQKGQVEPASSETEKRHFEIVIETFTGAGFEHYEISNFGKPGFWSDHNTSYWKGIPYLGIGPSAHSFNGTARKWNVANNARYINAISQNGSFFDQEHLSPQDRFNEKLMLGLRTAWGVDLKSLQQDCGIAFNEDQINTLTKNINDGYLMKEDETIKLTHAGKFIADRLASELFAI